METYVYDLGRDGHRILDYESRRIGRGILGIGRSPWSHCRWLEVEVGKCGGGYLDATIVLYTQVEFNR